MLGTSLLKASNNLNLNLGVNAGAHLHPAAAAGPRRRRPGSSTTRRNLDVLPERGQNLIGGQQNIDARDSKVVIRNVSRSRTWGTSCRKSSWRTRSGCCSPRGSGPTGAASTPKPQALLVPQGRGFLPVLEPAELPRRVQAAGRLRRVGQGTALRPEVHPARRDQEHRGLPELVVLGTIGAPDLQPEREREIEGGFDAYLWNQRPTWSPACIRRTSATCCYPASCISPRARSARSSMAARCGPRASRSRRRSSRSRRRNFNWLSRATFSANKSKITELDVPAFETGGFGTSLGAFKIEQGASATQIVGNDTCPTARGGRQGRRGQSGIPDGVHQRRHMPEFHAPYRAGLAAG